MHMREKRELGRGRDRDFSAEMIYMNILSFYEDPSGREIYQ